MRALSTLSIVAAITMIFSSSCFALDPSGVWAIEGRSDTRLEIKCEGDSCQCVFQSAYGKFKAAGYFRENNLVLAYNYLTPVGSNAFGFLVYEMQGDSVMLKRALDLNGKVVGKDKWIRQ